MRSGFVIPVLIYVLAGLGMAGGYAYTKLVEPGRNKKTADQAALVADQAAKQVQAAEQQAQQAAKDAQQAKTAAADALALNQKERGLYEQTAKNASGFVEGAKIALSADPNPTQPELVATGLLDSASTALGQPLTEEQRQVWIKTVAGLLAHNAETEAKVAQLTKEAAEARAQLGEVKARAEAADQHVVLLTGQLASQTTELVATTAKATELSSKTADLTAKNKSWADREQTWWGRVKAGGALGVILLLVIVAISIKLFGVQETASDAVALVHWVKGEAVKAGHDAVALEQKISDWWGNSSGKTQFNKITSKLRL